MRAKLAIPLISLTLLAGTCPNAVTPPAPSIDHVPNMGITILGSPGDNIGGAVSGPLNAQLYNVDLGSVLTVSTGASNAGGVKSLNLTIRQNTSTPFNLTTSSTPDANGKVPDGLEISGYSEAVGGDRFAGGSLRIRVTASSPSVEAGIGTSPIEVTATGANYSGGPLNAGRATYIITLVPVEPSSRHLQHVAIVTLTQTSVSGTGYSAWFPSQVQRVSGGVLSLSTSQAGVRLLKPTFNLADCSNPAATVSVSLDTPPPTAALPIPLRACPIPGVSEISISVRYELN